MTRVKICGVTRLEDARLAVEEGAWTVGLIFWSGSPRACSLDSAVEIATALRRQVGIAGVFVNATLEEVALVAEQVPLSMLQLHGEEGPSFCREAARRTGCRVIKAARVRDAASVRALRPFRVDYHLTDAHRRDLRGGTGESFDWALAREHDRDVPLILSGGLHEGNVGEGIRAVRPHAVDVASGTEARPGVKDPARLRAFFRAVAAADAELPEDESPPRRPDPGARQPGLSRPSRRALA